MWQPIKAAPEEGVFLVYRPTDTRRPIQGGRGSKSGKVVGGVFHFDAKPITHWMELPAPPLPDNAEISARRCDGLPGYRADLTGGK